MSRCHIQGTFQKLYHSGGGFSKHRNLRVVTSGKLRCPTRKVYGAIFKQIVGTLTIYRIVNARKSSNQSEDGYDDVIIILTNGNPSCGIEISENFREIQSVSINPRCREGVDKYCFCCISGL